MWSAQECTEHIGKLFDALAARNGALSSHEFMIEHNHMYRRCVADGSNAATILASVRAVFESRAPRLDRHLFMLCAAHIHSICAFVNRFHVPQGQPTIYEMADDLSRGLHTGPAGTGGTAGMGVTGGPPGTAGTSP